MDDLLCGWAFEMAGMQDRWRQLVRAAIRAEIEKGREVNSIAPKEIKRLVDAYVEAHPWEALVELLIGPI
jgi:hypothetical protein